ncbi:MAG: hypothetical protein KBG28_28900 [Kofleriaceae bacterium]|nr:hypothetical protein [Kofleriaceae bacterium]MBP9208020.1 hypothetical protein [Kofleriaceae bacterium]
MTRRLLTVLAVVALLATAACEKTTHENIDKWPNTQKGGGKLKKAAASRSIDPDLAAHAAVNLALSDRADINGEAEVKRIMEGLPEARVQQVMAKLAPRLWARARTEGDPMQVPGSVQIRGKDLLFDLRKYADAETRATIDGYLSDWYTTGFYEGRATLGRNLGVTVISTIGASAGARLKEAANSVVAKRDAKIGDELLLALAASGNPEAVRYVLDVASMDRGDPTLANRALSALYRAFVEPGGLFTAAPPASLAPTLDTLIAIAENPANDNRTVNDSVSLVRVVGMPGCLAPLAKMAASPDLGRRYIGANNALKCGGPKAIVTVVNALPEGKYDREALYGAVVAEIVRATPRDETIAAVRELLGARSWVARWVAIEAVAALGVKEDAARLRGLGGDGAKLQGYWGDQSGKPAKERKAEPTLGARAKELADKLGA